MSDLRRAAGLVVVGASSVLLTAVAAGQGRLAGVYIVVVIAAMRLPLWPAAAISAATVAGEIVAATLVHRRPGRADQRAAVLDHPVVPLHPADAPAARGPRPRRGAGRGAARVARGDAAGGGARRARPARARHARRARALAVGARAPARGRAPAGPRPRHRPGGRRRDRARPPPRRQRPQRGARGDRRPARRRDARARLARRGLRRARRARGQRRAARARLRGAARALPHRPGGAHQRHPPQRGRPRRAASSPTSRRARGWSCRTAGPPSARRRRSAAATG